MTKYLDNLLLTNAPLVVIDTETTGLHPELGHRVVELAAVRYEDWQQVAEIDQLIYPQRKINPEASAVNKIYDADLQGKPTMDKIMPELLEIIDGAVIVAHNAAFDSGFLGTELHMVRNLQELDSGPWQMSNQWICTMLLARRNFRFRKNNLGYIARELNARVTRAHRALDDVITTAQVLKKMSHELAKRNLTTVGDLLRAQGKRIVASPPRPAVLPAPLFNALERKTPIEIEYQTSTSRSAHTVIPIYSSRFSGSDYLIAVNIRNNELRTYRIDRILSIDHDN